ncbi:MAG: type III pantothenate kinase [Bacteroidales bacterium]|nr:type III pantothenate kinase [Bacteroidales bacterium]
MNLVIDIGNSYSKYYFFEGDRIVGHGRQAGNGLAFIPVAPSETDVIAPGKAGVIAPGKAFNRPDAVILSSVVTISDEARAWLTRLTCPVVHFSANTPIPLRNAYRTPATLGTDRLAAAIGAWTLKPHHPLLIIDAGSCITFDLVTADGVYAGGNISPGLHARLQAIGDYFPRLPLVAAEGPVPELGYDTQTAIRAGVIQGLKHEIEGYIHSFKAKYPSLFVFLTGGDEINFEDTIKSDIFADQFLVPRGLNRVLNDYMSLKTKQK